MFVGEGELGIGFVFDLVDGGGEVVYVFIVWCGLFSVCVLCVW